MSGVIKFTYNTKSLTIGQFHGKCFLYLSRLHVKTGELPGESGEIVCFDLVELQIVHLSANTEIKPVDVEMLIT